MSQSHVKVAWPKAGVLRICLVFPVVMADLYLILSVLFLNRNAGFWKTVPGETDVLGPQHHSSHIPPYHTVYLPLY